MTELKKYPSISRIGHEENNGILEEGHLVVKEKMDGANCLPYRQRIQTENGAVPIGKVVNYELDVDVLSYNPKTGETEYKPIVGYYNNGKAEKWIKIKFSGVRSSDIVTTPEHKIYTKCGKKEARNVCVGDKLITRKPEISGDVKELLVGSILGDATISDRNKSKNSHLSVTHGEQQHDYLRFKEKILGDVVSNTYTELSSYDENHRETEKLCLTTKSIKGIDELGNKFYNSEKVVPKDLSLSEKSVAILYCDDGNTSYGDSQRPRARFNVQGFTEREAKRLKEKMGYGGRVANYGAGPQIELYTDESERLFGDISKWVPECMSYKIPNKFWDSDIEWDTSGPKRYCATVVEAGETKEQSDQRYDIEVKDNHNYVTKDVVVSNCRFTYYPEEDRIVFGSRNIEYWNEKDTDKNFIHAVEFVRERVDIEELAYRNRVEGPLTFFGEAMHSHTLDYDWDRVPSFLGFDVYNHAQKGFLTFDNAKSMFEAIGLPVVPVVYEGPAKDFEDVEAPDSEYHDGPAEGVVIVNEDTRQLAKYRSKKFKEMHSGQSVTNPDEYETSDAKVLARKFTTEARVLKMIHKYENRGRTIEMSIMEDLWKKVFEDIIEEEFETIFLGNYELNTKDLRSEVASITADVLQSYLERPDNSVLN